MKKTKILYYGDGPQVATGFGSVTRNILMPLHETGKYDITVLGINYYGEPHEFPFPTWPVGLGADKDPYGIKFVQERIAQSDFDILFTVQDSFILEFVKELIPSLRFNNKRFKHICYFPIDGTPKRSWVEAMSVADVPVTYTKYGFNQCSEVYPPIKDKLRVIPHGINPSDFYPLPYGEMLDFRRKYFGPVADKFIITNVNRNQIRKDIPRSLMAFKEFHQQYPDSVYYLHCAVRDQGWNLDQVVESLGLVLNRDVVFPQNFGPSRGFPVPILNKIYNASDVVISTATGEGWGLSSTESMATKTPIIFPDNTACSEIVSNSEGGLLIPSGHDVEHFTVLPHDNEVVRPLASVSGMVEALEKLYKDEALRMELGESGYAWATSNIVWQDHISKMWLSLLDEAVDSMDSQEEDETCFDGAVEV